MREMAATSHQPQPPSLGLSSLPQDRLQTEQSPEKCEAARGPCPAEGASHPRPGDGAPTYLCALRWLVFIIFIAISTLGFTTESLSVISDRAQHGCVTHDSSRPASAGVSLGDREPLGSTPAPPQGKNLKLRGTRPTSLLSGIHVPISHFMHISAGCLSPMDLLSGPLKLSGSIKMESQHRSPPSCTDL